MPVLTPAGSSRELACDDCFARRKSVRKDSETPFEGQRA